jgi:hypothetical protein
LTLFLVPHPKAPPHPFIPKVLQARERGPTPFPSIVFTVGFAIESIKESRGAPLPLLQMSLLGDTLELGERHSYLLWRLVKNVSKPIKQ